MSNYKFFDHTADIGVEISGRTKKELFANASNAMFDILIETMTIKVHQPKRHKKRQRTVTVDGKDPEDLMINFLRELLYWFNGKVGSSAMQDNGVGNKRLKAKLMGEPYNKKKHRLKTEIKAVTYSA